MSALVRLYFTLNAMLLVMLGLVFPFQQPGTAGYVITVASAAVVGPSVLVSGALVYFDVDLPIPRIE